jgi:pimeloyl-ACP methyl ester carboxylesterase
LSLSAILAGILAFLVALVAISYLVEALRPAPERPDKLAWAPDIAIQYADIGGTKVRYIKTGAGSNLVLLHTLRTQLDIFQGLIPQLARQFTVYAYDYPGHGWSDIPRADFAPEDFYKWTAAFLDKLDIRQATVAGVSIGATIALVLAARHNPRVARVAAVNSYDYGPATGGVRKSSLTARLVLTFAGVPVLGATIMRLRNRLVLDRILRGGLAPPTALPEAFAREFYEVGNRPGHYQGFLNLLAHEWLWPDARNEYPAIKVPVLLVWGEEDWAPPDERERTRALIPRAVVETVRNGNHFLPLDRPQELQHLISRFAAD